MKEETLKQIVEHFLSLYEDEIRNDEVSNDLIHEWWWYTRDQYGYDAEGGSEVYPEVEKAICEAIIR